MRDQLKSLQDTYQGHFSIGVAVSPKTLDTSRELILNHFSSITAENAMKFAEVHPAPGQYDFSRADAIMDFARAHDKQVRGHTLVWHNQTSKWVFEGDRGTRVSRAELLERMQAHIYTVIDRYKGQIYAWDVVNEAIADHGDEDLRQSKWLEIIGPDYIDKAFELAHEADPDALLFYNDYNETNPEKRKKIIRLVRRLQEKGIPIHGIGLQAHWNIHWPSVDAIRLALDDYAAPGLAIHLTELDISVFRFDDHRKDLTAPTREMLQQQAKMYENVFALFRDYDQHIHSVTLWGVADDHTWLDDFPVRGRKNWPLLFDQYHRPKESFFRLVDF